MTDKELRRLGRAELIEILYELQKRNDELTAQNQQLRQSLDDRQLHIAEAGSIAEAAIRINGVLEAAQAAADQYLCSVRAAEAGTEQKLAEAESHADEIVRAAEAQAQRIIGDANAQADSRWAQFQQKADELIRAHNELRALTAARDGEAR